MSAVNVTMYKCTKSSHLNCSEMFPISHRVLVFYGKFATLNKIKQIDLKVTSDLCIATLLPMDK